MSENQSVERKVLALKYRPKRFEDLVGQSTVSQTLSLALDSNRLSHAYLFSGLRGSGKTSTARIMAKALICDKGPTSKPCEVCDNCNSANSNRHLDIIEMDAASNRGIDDIKDLIEHTKYKPSSAKFKVFIIDEVHMLTPQAFNALLKTLEEPPSFVKFILATTDPLKLPATILSRTQHFRFKKIATKDVIHHLSHILNIENISYEVEALEVLTRAGQGSLRDTLTLLDQAIIFAKGRVTLSSVTDMLGLVDPKVLDELFETILQKKDFTKFLTLFEEYETSQVCDELIIYLKQKMMDKDQKFSILLFDRFFRILSDAKYLLSINSDSGFVLILTLSKMVEATNLKTIDEVIEEVEKIPVKEVERVVVEVQEKTIEPEPIDIEEVSQIEVPEKVEIDYKKLYAEVGNKIFERSHDLGECFEKNFIFQAYEHNKLSIKSFATGECKNLLWKHFAFIRGEIESVFGSDCEIDFIKALESEIVTKELEQKKNDLEDISSISDEVLQSGSSIDDISAGCVADMVSGDKAKAPASQKELEVNEILESPMLSRAKELFDVRQIVINSRT